MSLFLVLMKNDFDALQKWFLKSVKITIINQRGAEESIVEVMTTTNSTSWNRPTKDMYIAAGFRMFAMQEKYMLTNRIFKR